MSKNSMTPIDFVVLWVDDQDPEWRASKRLHQGALADDRESTADNRFRDWNLFRYMFRAFEEFTPWVNHIYLVTCGHFPKWLNLDHPKLTLVRHDEFIPKEYLPTFSANPIELNLHRIPGLSEHFVYFNDDVFPIRPLEPDVFFRDGVPREVCIQSVLTPSKNDKVMSTIQFNDLGITNAFASKKEFCKKHLGKYLSPCYGKFFWRNLALLPLMKWTGFRSLHSATSLKKSTMEALWETHPQLLHETCLRKFRDCRDVNQYIFSQYHIVHGDFVPIAPKKRPYFEIGSDRRQYERCFAKQKADIVCLNDVGDVDFETEQWVLKNCFERILPKRSSFEVPEKAMQRITDVRVVQQKLNTILNHFADVCEKHGLRFYLSNGTLLGAVKYQKFIPWDDDVDILMPREDYDRLLQLADIDTEDYRLLAAERHANWKLPFAKLCDRHTILYETTADFGCEIGLFIDIFPIDCWNNRRCCAKREAKKSGFWRRCMSASLEKTFYSPRTGLKRCILYMIWRYSRMHGIEYFRKRVNRLSQKHATNPSAYIGCIVWSAYGVRELLPRELFDGTATVMFEGRAYPAFAGYDTYLHQLYGDYHQDPPPEKQKTHHTFELYLKNDEC